MRVPTEIPEQKILQPKLLLSTSLDGPDCFNVNNMGLKKKLKSIDDDQLGIVFSES